MLKQAAQKKKRSSTSGSRSKSKKPMHKNDSITIQLRNNQHGINGKHPHHMFHNHDLSTKLKTENSVSINKSKCSKKTSKSLKRVSHKQLYDYYLNLRASINLKDNPHSKDNSYMGSGQRKHSMYTKANPNKNHQSRSEYIEGEQLIYKKLFALKSQIAKVHVPQKFSSTEQLNRYYSEIKSTFGAISQIKPFESILNVLHQLYIGPLNEVFEIIKPYEQILRHKEQINSMIQQQIEQNESLIKQLDPEDLQILNLRQKIAQNAVLIEQSNKKSHSRSLQSSHKHNKSQIERQLQKQYQISQMRSQSPPQHVEFEEDPQSDRKEEVFFDSQKKFGEMRTAHENPGERGWKKPHPTPLDLREQSGRKTPQDRQSPLNGAYSAERQEIFDGESPIFQKPLGGKSANSGFGFKLDIPKISEASNVGFHDEFYSKLDEFSESWRNQALREKRF